MARLFVEGWAPEYGAPLDPDDALAPAEGTVDETVETQRWRPLDGHDDGIDVVAFVDGVRRVDARLIVEAPEGPVPGVCGTLAVGAVAWDRPAIRSLVTAERIERLAVIGGGRPEVVPPVDLEPGYRTIATPDDDPFAPVRALHSAMRSAEGQVASSLAADAFVIADGPLNELAPKPVVGHIKSHRVTYLSAERNQVVGALTPGQRTPVFTIGDYRRYSWYLRLARIRGGHGWSGIVRCEIAGSLPLEEAMRIADRTAAVLPIVASEPHVDPRAPQNLVPIGALERILRHRMGDPQLVLRALREALHEPEASLT